MGLDQFLGVNIVTEKDSVNMIQSNKMKKDILKHLSGYDLESSIIFDDGPRTPTDLIPVYDIDGKQLVMHSLFNVQDVRTNYRKANQIQNYFEERYYNSDELHSNREYNCIVTKVDEVTIDDIVGRIDRVLDQQGNEEIAEKEFPTTSGFFYGPTVYDDYYYETSAQFRTDLLRFKKICKEINEALQTTLYKAAIFYSSWW